MGDNNTHMASVTKTVSTSQDTAVKIPRTFIGKAWVNTTKTGKIYVNLKIDRGLKVELDENTPIQLWANTKREGKQDADYSASIQIPVAA